MARRAFLGVASSLLFAAGCGGRASAPDFTVHATGIVVETAAPFARQADFPARVEGTIGAALDYWGGGWSDLAGHTITITDAPHVTCGGSASALGCHDGPAIRLTTMDPGLGVFSCVEQTVLVHEVGHAVIGDARHEDPRWMEMDALSAQLGGRVGYTPEGVQPCVIYVSVWRHPLGVP